ncbi:hypothetical protein EBL85_15750 [Marichromatium sp. AB32]|nr:hypothetical protein [Marichromatium gracile]RNE88803.1 hypothetical protein EBL84_14210 [Marichromatium sp. AB31]RNE89977.1 hypothetical protein EBL85_15750 [Marichromatium sp. AB32]
MLDLLVVDGHAARVGLRRALPGVAWRAVVGGPPWAACSLPQMVALSPSAPVMETTRLSGILAGD